MNLAEPSSGDLSASGSGKTPTKLTSPASTKQTIHSKNNKDSRKGTRSLGGGVSPLTKVSTMKANNMVTIATIENTTKGTSDTIETNRPARKRGKRCKKKNHK